MIVKSLKIKKLNNKEQTETDRVSFVASTDAVDRYNDIVEQNWELENYRNNPIVLFNHNQAALPIGRGYVKVENNQLLIDVEFDMEDATAAEIARKTKAGFLNAVSVGFQPLQFVPRSDLPQEHKYAGSSGNLYTKSELLEVSIVTVPAQGEATAAKEFDISEFTGVLKTKSALNVKKNILNSIKKHILYVEETEDKYVVHFAKGEMEEVEEPEEEIEAEEDSFLDEFLKADEEDEEEKEEYKAEEEDEEDEEDDDNKKHFNHALLRALTLIGVNND